MTAISPTLVQPRLDALSARAEALAALKDDLASQPGSATASARERLQRIKDQLEFLKRWGFPPEITLQQAAQLARELSSAARAFAENAGLQTAAPVTAHTAPIGYGEALQDEADTTPLSAADRSTAEDFLSTARQIKLLMEQARRKTQQEKAENARQAASDTTGLDNSVASLQQLLDIAPAASFSGLAAILPSL